MEMHLISIDDLSNSDIDRVLHRAHNLQTGARPDAGRQRVVGLLFGQTSLRTQVGFGSATARLGWSAITLPGRRGDATSMAESWDDTLRTLSGYLDILVARPGVPLDRQMLRESLSTPFINAGSVGSDAEHPSQSLIDLFAIQQHCGAMEDISIALCGDLRMRAARSLLRLLARRQPNRLFLSTSEKLNPELPEELDSLAEFLPLADLPQDLDVLYVIGIPHQAIPEEERDTLRVSESVLTRFRESTIVLSPLPLIDEIDEAARRDPRVRYFAQSDGGLFVRMALLEAVASPETGA